MNTLAFVNFLLIKIFPTLIHQYFPPLKFCAIRYVAIHSIDSITEGYTIYVVRHLVTLKKQIGYKYIPNFLVVSPEFQTTHLGS